MNKAMAHVLAAALAVVVLGRPSAAPRANLVLVTLDTVRADHLGSYGYRTAATPVLDRLAREGVRFADATTQSPLTGPAHAALLTGVYPARYGLRDNGSTPVPASVTTLAEALKGNGYRTAAFIGAFILDRAYGFDHGFDVFDSRFGRFAAGDKLKAERTADEVLAPALAWLQAASTDQPFFVWVHLYDAHAPYAAPAPFRARFRQRPYDGEIAYVDSSVGRLVAKLVERGVLEKTLIVAVGDHGESLGQHGEEDHGIFLYDAVLHIPWVMRLPGAERAGTVVAGQVRAVDLMPTLLDTLGLGVPSGLDGESVLGLVRGRTRRDTPVSYAESWFPQLHYGWSELRSARVGEWKYVAAPKPELYDLRRDRREELNLVDRQHGVAGRLSADVARISASFGPSAALQAPLPDPETLERLRSLGYVGFTGGARSTGRGPDPKDMLGQDRLFRQLITEASASLRRHQPGVAQEKLKKAIALNDRAYDAHLLLGDVYAEQQQWDRAVGEYEAAALLNPVGADPVIAAALALTSQGRFDRAQQKIDRATQLEPRSGQVPFARGRLAERQGNIVQAFSFYEEAVTANPSDPQPRARLANLAMRLRNVDVATAQFTALLAMGFEPARSHYGLGWAAEARGDRATAAAEYRRALGVDPSLTAARDGLARVGKQP